MIEQDNTYRKPPESDNRPGRNREAARSVAEEAMTRKARVNLMAEIGRIIRQRGWTQAEAARVLRVRQPRVAEIMGLKAQHYSTDLLMKFLYRLGRTVSLVVEAKDGKHGKSN